MSILDVQRQSRQGSYTPIELVTPGGRVACRYWETDRPQRACLWVPGAVGGWHSPARNLYPRLAEEFQEQGVASLQVRYRYPADLDECVADVMAGLDFLQNEGVRRAGLIGHSFGGTVVIQAAAACEIVRTVVALATQSYGATRPAALLAPRCSILLAHGEADEIVPPHCSLSVHDATRACRKLAILPDARHGLDEAADQLADLIREWIAERL